MKLIARILAIVGVRAILLATIAFSVASCGSTTTTSDGTGTNSNGGSGSGSGSDSVGQSLVSINSGSSKVAYVLDLYQDQAVIYIPSASVYTSIYLSTASYFPAGVIYYSSAGCTGTAVGTFNGTIGNSVIYGNTKYYSVTSTTSLFAYQSYWSIGGCTNASATTSAGYIYGTLSQTTQPYDFSSLAPISLTFN